MQVSAAENLLVHCFSDEAIILDLNSEIYYALNEVGIQMWQALEACGSIESACDLLAARYDVPLETLRCDLQEFVAQLQARNLVEIRE